MDALPLPLAIVAIIAVSASIGVIAGYLRLRRILVLVLLTIVFVVPIGILSLPYYLPEPKTWLRTSFTAVAQLALPCLVLVVLPTWAALVLTRKAVKNSHGLSLLPPNRQL
jgi:hypothetical protein